MQNYRLVMFLIKLQEKKGVKFVIKPKSYSIYADSVIIYLLYKLFEVIHKALYEYILCY